MNASLPIDMVKIQNMSSNWKKIHSGGSFAKILHQCRELRGKMTEACRHSKGKVETLKSTFNQKTEKINKYERFKERKTKRISIDKNEMEKFRGLAKSRLDTINFKTLPKVKKDSEVEGLFRFLFVHLYKEKEADFDIDTFIKFAVKKNVGELKKRLAQFEISNIGKKGLERLEQVVLTEGAEQGVPGQRHQPGPDGTARVAGSEVRGLLVPDQHDEARELPD